MIKTSLTSLIDEIPRTKSWKTSVNDYLNCEVSICFGCQLMSLIIVSRLALYPSGSISELKIKSFSRESLVNVSIGSISEWLYIPGVTVPNTLRCVPVLLIWN